LDDWLASAEQKYLKEDEDTEQWQRQNSSTRKYLDDDDEPFACHSSAHGASRETRER